MSKKEYEVKEEYLPKSARKLHDAARSAVERTKIWLKFKKIRYVKTDAKPVRVISHLKPKSYRA